VLESADSVTIRFTMTGTHMSEFMGVRSTGRRIALPGITSSASRVAILPRPRNPELPPNPAIRHPQVGHYEIDFVVCDGGGICILVGDFPTSLHVCR